MDDLIRKVLEVLPKAQLDEDLDGQIVIYTGLRETDNDNLEEFECDA